MTAEIAILNKTAVALATDSAVTISAGSYQQKIYDSADKLFDLCAPTPMGVMIYNGMQFLQTPLPMLIADYRAAKGSAKRLPEAGMELLRHLCQWGKDAPAPVANESVALMINAILDGIKARVTMKIDELFTSSSSPPDPNKSIRIFFEEAVALYERILEKAPNAEFIGADGKVGTLRITAPRRAMVRDIVSEQFVGEQPEMLERLTKIGCLAILKNRLSGGQTGIVVSGFGEKDIFPSLCSYEIDGMAFGKLKFIGTNEVDIDRANERARVLPFAQKEMVERFLYGLDVDIERRLSQFCKATVPAIRKEIFEHLEMSDNDRVALQAKAREAEDAFVRESLRKTFDDIRSQSRSAIEDMVEFMPKPELATMAEALVNLTSIKRKVSRGMETVGGPIDVAVISRSDGFVWVKRKHYFSSELNPRYVNRVRDIQARRWGESK